MKLDSEQTQKLKKEEVINDESEVETKQVGEPERLAESIIDTIIDTLGKGEE